MPADQRLAAGDPPALQVDDRLVVEREFVVDDRLAEVEFDCAAGLHARVHLDLEEAIEAAAVRLGPVEREVGVLHQGIRLVAVGRGQRDAGADADHDLVSVEGNRAAPTTSIRRAASTETSCGCSDGTWTMANSSPPSRATMSSPRTQLRMRSAAVCRAGRRPGGRACR